MDPAKFKAPYIRLDDIRAKADDIRKKYLKGDSIPINIEWLMESAFNLDIIPVPGLKEAGDIDALLRRDFTGIEVDLNEYMDERYNNRMRFSLAHELGHLVLHSDELPEYKSIEEYNDFIQRMPDDSYKWMELHANEFAGRLLVPREILIREVKENIDYARVKGFTKWDETGLSAEEYIADKIAQRFNVSEEVIVRRIKAERLMPLRGHKT